MTQRRVAIVAASPAIVGGHSVQAVALAGHLRREGVDVEYVPIDVALPRALRWVRRVRGLRTIVNELLYLLSLRRLIGADVVHAFSASYWSFLLAPVPAMIVGRLVGARVVLNYHSGEIADHLDRWGIAVHPWLRLAHEIVVCSRFQQAVFERHGYRCRAIANVVSLDAFAWRARDPIGPRLICSRNFEPYYRVDVVVEAFGRIRARRPDAVLVLAGGGSGEPAVKAAVERIGSGGITLAGTVTSADMARLLDGADIYLNASVVDNQPVSLIEACASGAVVVSTRVGGVPEFIRHEGSGLLVDGPDPEALAEAVLRLLDEPGLARRLAGAARLEVERFTWNVVRDAWAAAYGWPFEPPAGAVPSLSLPVHNVGGQA